MTSLGSMGHLLHLHIFMYNQSLMSFFMLIHYLTFIYASLNILRHFSLHFFSFYVFLTYLKNVLCYIFFLSILLYTFTLSLLINPYIFVSVSFLFPHLFLHLFIYVFCHSSCLYSFPLSMFLFFLHLFLYFVTLPSLKLYCNIYFIFILLCVDLVSSNPLLFICII